jgi:hypothetical protein
MTEFPPLPKPFHTFPISQTTSVEVWASDSMLAFRAEGIAIAVAAEREACAQLCDKWASSNHVYVNGAIRCAEDIRARTDSAST